MTREATLLAKHEELQKCIQTRASQLLELYRSTVVLSRIQNLSLDASEPLNIDLAGEKSFLEANDLSLGHFFNPSTLPSLSRTFSFRQRSPTSRNRDAETLDSANKPLASASTDETSPQLSSEQQQDTGLASPTGPSYLSEPDHRLPRPEITSLPSEQKIGPSERTTNEDERDRKNALNVLRSVVTDEPSGTNSLDTAPLSADDAGSLPGTVLTPLEAHSTPDQSHTVHLSSEAEHKERLSDVNSIQKPSSDEHFTEDRLSVPEPDLHPNPDVSVHRKESQGQTEITQIPDPSVHGTRANGVPGSQKNIAHADAIGEGSPFTPDKQLRLEESRSLIGNHNAFVPDLSRQGSDSHISQPAPTEDVQDKTNDGSAAGLSSTVSQPLHDIRSERREIDATSEKSAIRSYAHPGIASDAGKDITLSQRPPMRIDTSLSQMTDQVRVPSSKKFSESSVSVSQTPPDSAASARVIQTPAQGQSPPERMTTRVSSGALRHKSVSEILGEIPKPLVSLSDRALGERSAIDGGREFGIHSPRSATSTTSPDPATFRLRLSELKEKDKSKLSTVVFARKQTHSSTQHASDSQSQDLQVTQAKARNTEYFLPLFSAQAATPPQSQLLNRLWVASSREERMSMQVKVKSPPTVRAPVPESAPTPDLIPSAEDDSSDAAEDEVYNLDAFHGTAPAAIFTMAPEMFYFGLKKTCVTDKLLHELPLYQPSVHVQEAALCQSSAGSDTEWRTALLPVSKYNEGSLMSHDEGPSRKRSRYDYSDVDGLDLETLRDATTATSEGEASTMQAEQDEVALFNPENKHIRDRIHAGHAFRPPSEFIMPSQSFFESRHSSQWTQAEDDELRRLVREYAYNWSLIASCLGVPSIFSSGAERRTPWECFERWIGLEGLPAEMAKTQYFRAYHSRLQAAQSTHEAQQQAIHQQQGSNAPLRRRNTQPFLVERRKNTKHVHLVNAMRNLARKREATAKKQEEAAELAAMRKATQPVQPRHTMQTPQEFSRLKHERELRMQEQARLQRMQYLQQQKVVLATQRASLQPGLNQHPGGASLAQSGRHPIQAVANGNGPVNVLANGQVPSNLAGQPRAPQMPRPSNGIHGTAPFPANQQAIPHAPMQPAAHMPGAPRVAPQMASDSMRVYQEATRVQAEQQRFLQQQRQQQQQHPQPNGQSSPNINNSSFMPPNGSSTHHTVQGRPVSPSINGVPASNGSSASPRMNNPSQAQALSSGMMPTINHIQNHLRTRNPNASQEQINQMATDRLKQYQASHSLTHSHVHAAMQAAAGGNAVSNAASSNGLSSLQPPSQQQPPTAIMNGTSALNMQQYNQNLRNHQQHQRNRSSGTPFSGQRPPSQGSQIHRTPSAQGGHPSPSPVPSQVQVASAQ
ncbi:hypothetical protein Q9189_000047 [Teloschistes chrysophthalmus]